MIAANAARFPAKNGQAESGRYEGFTDN